MSLAGWFPNDLLHNIVVRFSRIFLRVSTFVRCKDIGKILEFLGHHSTRVKLWCLYRKSLRACGNTSSATIVILPCCTVTSMQCGKELFWTAGCFPKLLLKLSTIRFLFGQGQWLEKHPQGKEYPFCAASIL